MKFGRIDVAVNAAGISGDIAKMGDQETENMHRVLGVNLKGVWFCEKAEIEVMMGQEKRELCNGLPHQTRGSIVNIGSVGSLIGLGNINSYVMAKHAVLGLTRTDASDYGPEGIRINCVCPGWINTPMLPKGAFETGAFEKVLGSIPVKRLGLPEEVAFTISFLASDRASYINGTSVVIDGGMTGAGPAMNSN